MNPHIEEVILTETRRGEGKEATDPIRPVLQVWTKQGELLAERDSWEEERRRHAEVDSER